jgi:hypothetical protein
MQTALRKQADRVFSREKSSLSDTATLCRPNLNASAAF